MIKNKGSLPSGKVFDTTKEDALKAAKIRKTAATKMSMEHSAGDVIGDILPLVGAAVAGVASGGNPAAIKAGYQGGKAVGGMVSDKEERENVYQEATAAEEEMLQGGQPQDGQPKKKKKKEKEEGDSGDAFTKALALYEKYNKVQGE